MSLTIFEGLQSEIFVPITPKPVWAPVTKELKDMKVALATAAGVHLKTDKRFNLAGDTTFREIPDTAHSSDLMVSHGGYDNADANRDINCMFPIDRLHELAKKGFIKSVAEFHYGFMGGGGDQEAFTNSTGPAIAKKLKENTPTCLPTKSPSAVPSATGDKISSSPTPRSEMPAFTKANIGSTPKATQPCRSCSMLFSIDLPGSSLKLSGMKKADTTPASVA